MCRRPDVYAVSAATHAGATYHFANAQNRAVLTERLLGGGERPAYGWVPPGVEGYRGAEFSWAPLPWPARLAEAQRLFAVRRQLQQNQLAQINERVRQTEQQISSLQAQMHASQKQADLVKPELEGLRSLRDRQLVTVNRLNQVERTAVDLQGAVKRAKRLLQQAELGTGRAQVTPGISIAGLGGAGLAQQRRRLGKLLPT